ncbi:MAG: DUF4258 domain-containing protein [Gemmatimonadota bacterium]
MDSSNAERPTYDLTAHAQRVISERALEVEWIERVLREPDFEETDRSDPDVRHALAAIPEREGRILRVVYNHCMQPPRIVTAYFDRSAKKR